MLLNHITVDMLYSLVCIHLGILNLSENEFFFYSDKAIWFTLFNIYEKCMFLHACTKEYVYKMYI